MDGDIVVGVSSTSGHGQHAFAYDVGADDPQMIDLGSVGFASEATAVNGTVVVGYTQTPQGDRAFAYDFGAADPHMILLGALGAGPSSATAVDGSIVVGISQVSPSNEGHAFMYDLAAASPEMIDLGAGPGGTFSRPNAIDDGVVAGYRQTTSGDVASVYDLDAQNPQWVDIDTHLPRSSATHITGGVVAGDTYSPVTWEQRVFLHDLADPEIVDVGTLGASTPFLVDFDGRFAVGNDFLPGGQDRRVWAYDLAASNPADRKSVV